LIQSIAQCVAVVLIRRYRPDIPRPFSMFLYPLPAVIALGGWLCILVASGFEYVIAGALLMAVGILAYLWRARRQAVWPFTAP
jgi:hypothetical protein